jgi:hypothetical protein
MAPYVSGGAVADVRLGDGAPRKEFQVDGVIEVGLDLSLDTQRRFILRGAASFGPRSAVALGMAVGGGARTR